MYAILSSFFSFFMTSSPICLLFTSCPSSLLSSDSISSTTASTCSTDIGRFSQDFIMPVFNFSLLNFSLLPSFFTTVRSKSSSLSYVVNRFLHLRHSLLLLVAEASCGSRLSTTLVSFDSQYAHFICYDTPLLAAVGFLLLFL